MKLIIAGYEVELTAKGRYSDQASEEDTRYFLNQLSIWADEAAEKKCFPKPAGSAARTQHLAVSRNRHTNPLYSGCFCGTIKNNAF